MDQARDLEMLEGRILAQRRLLARLVALCPDPHWHQIGNWLDERQIFHDGQEDPGAVPAEGLAQQAAMADEFRELLRLAGEYRHAASGDTDN